MSDFKDQYLSDVAAAAEALDLAYNQSDFATQVQMKPSRDAAFEALEAARRQLLSGQIVVTQAHITAMADIRQQIENAGDTQSLIVGAGQLLVSLKKMIV